MSVGLGITTYNRPTSLALVLDAVECRLLGVIDALHIFEDGSEETARLQYQQIAERMHGLGVAGSFVQAPENRGVAHAKNALLRRMLAEGHDWLILAEDDIIPLDAKAVTGYMAACERSGLHHLNFHLHGPLNRDPVSGRQDPRWPGVTLWPHFVGAWSIYSRECLEAVGLLDEGFRNAWEHVEHTFRLGLAGYTALGMGHAADATGSEGWLWAKEDQPSSIGANPENVERGREHWRSAHPDSYPLVFRW